jgi:hypothetical protein
MPAAQSVTAGQTTTFRLPIGRNFHSLDLLGAGTAFAPGDLSEIRVLVNNKVIQRYSGADRDTMNQFDGRSAAVISAAAFNLCIPFDRYGILTKAGEEETSLNTGSVDPNTGKVINNLAIEVDIASVGPTGTLTLDLYATTSEQIPGGPGTLPYCLKSTRDFSSAAEYDLSDFPRGGVTTQFIDRLFFKPSTSTLETLRVLANSYKLFERTAALNERKQSDGIRVPQGGWYVIDRTEHGYGGDPFDVRGIDDWRVQFTTGAAMTVTAYAHYLGGLGD